VDNVAPDFARGGKDRPGQDSFFRASIADLLIFVDAIGVAYWLSDRISLLQLIALHSAAAIILMAVRILLLRRGSPSVYFEAALCVLAGPIGALAMRIVSLAPTDVSAEAERANLQKTGGSFRLPDAIFEAHIQGRRSIKTEAQRQSYFDVIRNGDLSTQNEIIGAISRNYEPEMYPALSLALGSRSPTLKVQAAAIYSRLRRTFGETANDLLKADLNNLSVEEAIAYHDDLLRVARSGFLDSERTDALISRAKELEAYGLHHSRRRSHSGPFVRTIARRERDVRKPGPRLKRYSCGGIG
jgi:hypothetical protein